MKQLLFAALFAVTTITVKAQVTFTNNSPCPLQITVVCIDQATCTPTPLGSATNLPANTQNISIPSPTGCGPGQEAGYMIDYDPSTGCNGSPIYFTSDPASPCPQGSPAWPPGSSYPLQPCSSCSGTDMVDIAFNYDPITGGGHFAAH